MLWLLCCLPIFLPNHLPVFPPYLCPYFPNNQSSPTPFNTCPEVVDSTTVPMFQAASQKAQNGHFQVRWNQQSNWTTHQVATTCIISPLSQHKHTCLHIEKKKDTECVHTHHIYIYIIYNYYICYAAMHQIMYIYIYTHISVFLTTAHTPQVNPARFMRDD